MKLALRLAVTSGLVAAILVWIGDDEASGIEKIAGVLARADLRLVALVFAIATLDRALMVLKWGLLLRSRGLALPFFRGLRIYCASLVWGLFLPSTVGADALRVALTIRTGLPGNDVVASVVIERLVGFLSALFTGLLGLVLLGALTQLGPPWSSLWWMASLALLAATGVFALSLSQALFDRLFSQLPEAIRERTLVRRLQRLHATYVAYSSDARSIGLFAVLTLLENGVSILMCWAAALALGIDVGLLFIAGALPVTLLVARLPLSIDGLGVFEGVFAGLMWLAGVPEQEAIAIALLGRLVQIAAWLPWWMAHVLSVGEFRPPAGPTAHSDAAPREAASGSSPDERTDRV